MPHQSPSELIQTLSELCASDCAAVAAYPARFDCPPSDYLFQPFLEATSPDGPEFVLKPTKADAGPLAWSMEQALSALELE